MSRQASGLKAWALQRATAVYLAVFSLYLLLYFVFSAPTDFETWRAWVTGPWISLGLLLFVPSLLLHAWVGIRDVLIDYVHPMGMRVLLLSLFAFVFVASGLWAVQALMLARIG